MKRAFQKWGKATVAVFAMVVLFACGQENVNMEIVPKGFYIKLNGMKTKIPIDSMACHSDTTAYIVVDGNGYYIVFDEINYGYGHR